MSRDLDLQAGDLDRRITIQSLPANAPRNDWNETDLVNGWMDVDTVWAAIEPAAGRELFYGETISPDITHLITIRFYPRFSPKWRISFKDLQTGSIRLFNVESAIDIKDRHIKHLLACKEPVQ